MYIRYSEDNLRLDINERLVHAKAKKEAWSKVEIKKKKDGSEFKELTKSCLVGANGDKIPLYPTNSANGYIVSGTKIKINNWSDAGYVNDSIFTTDEWEKGMDESRKIDLLMRVPFQYNTAEEVRNKIKKRIEELEKEIKDCEQALIDLHEVYELYITGLNEVETRMYRNCKGNKILEKCLCDIVSMR